MRLDKYLSQLGHTRSEAKRLCAAGRVRLGSVLVHDASTHVEPGDPVFLDGRPLTAETHQHLMLHKPRGVITATGDARGAPTVIDLIPAPQRRKGLGPVGRLDKDVTGLLILTTDGQLAHRLISPKWRVEKVYRARVDGVLTEEHARRMAEGVPLKDFTARPAKLAILESGEHSLAELTVTEGKYHQVKRMFGALGCPVLALERLSVGGLALDPALDPGQWRPLTADEAARLYKLVEME